MYGSLKRKAMKDNIVDLNERKEQKALDDGFTLAMEEYNSEIAIADDFIVYSKNRFNRLQVYMTKVFFGWKIKNYDKERTVPTRTD